ncbi:hypothetical protein D3C75_393880 [compost metagenome]
MVASAPAGVALTTPANIQLSAGQTLTATAGESADFSVFKRFSVAAGEAISLFAQKLGLKLFAARGAVEIQAQSDAMTLQADKALTLSSINDEIILNAAKGFTFVSQGVLIKVKDGKVRIVAPEGVEVDSDNVVFNGSTSMEKALATMTLKDPVYANPMSGRFQVKDSSSNEPQPHVPYRMETADGRVVRGVTDAEGYTQRHHGLDPQNIKLFIE